MQTEPKRLYRSRSDRMIGGVCAGIGHYLNLDATVIRLLFVLLGFLTSGIPAVIGYIILLVVVPEEPLASTAGGASPAAYTAPVEPAGPVVDTTFTETPPSEPPSI